MVPLWILLLFLLVIVLWMLPDPVFFEICHKYAQGPAEPKANDKPLAKASAIKKAQEMPATRAAHVSSTSKPRSQQKTCNNEPRKEPLTKPIYIPVPRSVRHEFDSVARRVPRRNVLPLFKRLLRGPRDRDGAGWIYIYQHKTAESSSVANKCWKVGCTSFTVEKRLKQWSNQCGHNPVLAGRVPVKYNKLCESLIHMELRFRRRWLGNRPCKCKQGNGKGHREWFSGTLLDMEEAVKFWADYVNRIWPN